MQKCRCKIEHFCTSSQKWLEDPGGNESPLTSTTFLMCLLTTEGSGLVVTPEAQSRGACALLGVVGDVGCKGPMRDNKTAVTTKKEL